jgi:hypothetical protein
VTLVAGERCRASGREDLLRNSKTVEILEIK